MASRRRRVQVLDRLQRAAERFRGVLHVASRANVEDRIRAQQTEEAEVASVAERWDAAFAAWCASCGAPQYLLPWLDRCIEDARLASRNKISSPYENAHLQGMEDGIRLVRARFASSDAGSTVKSARPDPV
jgi:anti-sigma-K factor RskA